jgi:purine-binding chemotaxis protein CheW
MNATPGSRTDAGFAPALAPAIAEHSQYLTFLVGKEQFALGLLAVREIIEYHAMTEVPMMPREIRGVINLRGAVVPVMDLSARFGGPATEPTRRTCIVILELELQGGLQIMGLMVDAVSQVLDIPAREIEAAPNFGTEIASEFIQGMGKVNGKFVILLDVNHILSIDQSQALARIHRPGAASGQ